MRLLVFCSLTFITKTQEIYEGNCVFLDWRHHSLHCSFQRRLSQKTGIRTRKHKANNPGQSEHNQNKLKTVRMTSVLH